MRDPPKIDRYEILGQLGRGANGIVYLGRDPKLGREVAVKVINPDRLGDRNVHARFHREAKAVALLHHPNILKLYDYSGASAHTAYLVVERLYGQNLDDLLLELGKPLDAPVAAAAAHEIGLALHHAHLMSIVHRDLKPENVFLEPEGRVVLCDFGIARSFDAKEEGTLAGRNTKLAGSPLYMSPEQIVTPQSISATSDLFCLGSLLFYLVTGQHAFYADSVANVLKRISQAKPASLRDTRPGLPERYYRIVEKLLQHAPSQRLQSAKDVCEALLPLVREGGYADPRRALQSMLEPLKQRRTRPRAQLIPLEDMDEEAKTTIVTMTKLMATKPQKTLIEAPPSQSPVKVASQPKAASQYSDSNRIVHKQKAKKRERIIIAASAILSLAIVVAAMLFASSDKPKPVFSSPLVGSMRLNISPWADVTIDGKHLGHSAAIQLVQLSPGKHEVKLSHPTLGSVAQQVDVTAGETTVLDVNLNR